MQLLIYHGPEPRKPLVAVAEVEWEGATLGVGMIELKSATATNELVYACAGAAHKACYHAKSYPKDIRVDDATFCRLVD